MPIELASAVGAVVAHDGFRVGLLATAFGFGFRHGIDWDHIAALTDIAGSQDTARRALRLSTLYALGHATVVLALGTLAVLLSERLSPSVDSVMEHVVGATLVALGIYVLVSLVRHGRNFRMRSRWMLVIAGVRNLWRRFQARTQPEIVVEHAHDDARALQPVRAPQAAPPRAHAGHRHVHVARLPEDPFLEYAPATAFGIGMIHGVGAETPTQVVVFLAAAGAGGRGAGLVLLGAFVVGLLVSNSAVALAAAFGFVRASQNFAVYAAVSAVTAVGSLAVGLVFLLGRGGVLPALFG